MFLNKVHDQKVELLRAVFRNMYLKEKCDTLDGECKMLAEHILSSQVTKAEKTETKSILEKELNSLRQLHDQKMHELTLANKQIMSMSLILEHSKSSILHSVNENESIDDNLDVKNDMIKCLQEELVHVGLKAAEKWALIRELRQIKDELEKDKEMLTKTKPETISRLQEELIGAKLLECQYSLEFENIKHVLQKMKVELDTHKTVDDQKKNTRILDGNVKLSSKGVLWNNNNKNNLQTEVVDEIKKLEKEKIHLENKIPELHNKIEVLNKHIQFKEKERSRLQEKLDNIRLKFQSLENITSERKRQYVHLERSASEKVFTIRNSCTEKKQNINDLSTALQNISERRQSNTNHVAIEELNTIQALEEQIAILEERINQLASETMNLQANVF